MKVSDSRDHGGPGILPLQDWEDVDLIGRYSVLAVRKTGRRDAPGQLGHLEVDTDTCGDLIRGFVWTAPRRSMPAWGFVFPTSVESQGSVDRGPTTPVFRDGETAAGVGTPTTRPTGDVGLRPLRRAWETDDRFDELISSTPDGWPVAPVGFYGITVAGTDEDSQQECFFPLDPRLPLPHRNAPWQSGAVTCDLDSEGKPDPDYHARLHSALRVIRGGDGGRNVLALNLTRSGQRDTRGGFVFDRTPRDRDGRDLLGVTTPVYRDAFGRSIDPDFVPGLKQVRLIQAERDRRIAEKYPALGSAREASGTTGASKSSGAPPVGGRGVRPSGVVAPGHGAIWTPEGREQAPGSIVAYLSQNDGGPLDPGSGDDKHRIGRTFDGYPLQPAHLSTAALWRNRDRAWEDGPMRFEREYRQGVDATVPVPVHLAYDILSGDFAWWTTSYLYDPSGPPPPPPPTDPPITPRDPPPPPPPDTPITPRDPPPPPPPPITPDDPNDPRPGRPGWPDLTGDGLTPRGQGLWQEEITGTLLDTAGAPVKDRPWEPQRIREHSSTTVRSGVAMLQELTLPGLSGRPQALRTGLPDRRYSRHIGEGDRVALDEEQPLTARLEAYGAQGGSTGSYLAGGGAGGGIPYTQKPGQSRWPGGTAPGGFILLPPEADMSDVDRSLDPGTVSETHLLAGPNTAFASGSPELSSGAIKDAWKWNRDGDGNLTFKEVDSSAVEDPLFAMISGGGIWLEEQPSVPSPPSTGGYLYVLNTGLWFKGSAGTETKLADP